MGIKMKKIMLFILALAVIGLLVNLNRVSTYFFGTEIHEKYNNIFLTGSRWTIVKYLI